MLWITLDSNFKPLVLHFTHKYPFLHNHNISHENHLSQAPTRGSKESTKASSFIFTQQTQRELEREESISKWLLHFLQLGVLVLPSMEVGALQLLVRTTPCWPSQCHHRFAWGGESQWDCSQWWRMSMKGGESLHLLWWSLET